MQWTSAPNIAGAPLPQRARGYWKARASAIREEVEAFLETEYGQLPLWFAVAFGAGIAFWFALPDPRQWTGFLFLAAGLALFGFTVATGRLGRALGWLGLGLAAGCALVWVRSESVAAPPLERPRMAQFQAHVERVEPLASRDSIRLTLEPLSGVGLPPRIRVNVSDSQPMAGLAAGARIELRAWLMPPPPMALPGSHDFARDFWFKGIGATGRALGTVNILQPAPESGIAGVRARLDRHIRERLPGSPGTVATAFATGDQNAISEVDAEAMRRSGLAHLLSVGGLHITAAVGLTMLLTLRLLALSQTLALRLNLVLVAAAAGALGGIGYTLLTGSQVPMVRSCIAALCILAGIALGRDAINMRLLAVAALVILAFRPEAVTGASFQLSFAAVGAIIALHSTAWARNLFHRREEPWLSRVGRGALNLLVTGLVVESAVVPFALYHFHRAGLYGVLANIVAIPLTSMVILPLEAIALFFDAFGLGRPFWELTRWSLEALLWIAHTVANATRLAMIPGMPVWAFAAIVLGLAWLSLWVGRIRRLGLAPIAIGMLGTWLSPTPDLVVTNDGRHLAMVGSGGAPVLLRDRSGHFVRVLMSEAIGFDGDALALAGQPFARCSRDSCVAEIERSGRTWRILATRSGQWIDWVPLTRACAEADIVVSDRWLPRGCTPRWLKLDRKGLEPTGGVSIYLGGKEPRVETVAERVGQHPWRSPNFR